MARRTLEAWRFNHLRDNSNKTAIGRRSLSSPVAYLLRHGLLKGSILDYGCGRGTDADTLQAAKYDPASRAGIENVDALSRRYRTIFCAYVLNVVPDATVRQHIVDDIQSLLAPGGVAYIAIRADKRSLNGLTTRGTWQGYTPLDGPMFAKGSGWHMWRIEAPRKTTTATTTRAMAAQ